jgi:hypothetical protein
VSHLLPSPCSTASVTPRTYWLTQPHTTMPWITSTLHLPPQQQQPQQLQE